MSSHHGGRPPAGGDSDDKVFTFTELLQALAKVWKSAARLHLVLLVGAAAAVFGAGVTVGRFWASRSSGDAPPLARAVPAGVVNYTFTTRLDKPTMLQSAISQFVQSPGQEVAVLWVTTDELAAGQATSAFAAEVTSNLGRGVECLAFLVSRDGSLRELPQSASGRMVTLTAPAADAHTRLLIVARVEIASGQDLGRTPVTVRVK